MKTSEKLDALCAALAKAQGEMKGAVKDSRNPHFQSAYADLASIWDACRGPLTSNGLSVAQIPDMTEDGKVVLRTRLSHVSDQFIEGVLPINPVKADPQGLGSAITYMRRYALAAMAGIAPEDDDGEAASGRKTEREQAGPARTATPRDPPKTDTPPPPAPRVPAAFWTQPSYAVKTFKSAGELAEKIGILADEAPDTGALVKVETDNATLIKNIADDGLRDRILERIKNRHETLTLARNAAA